MTFTAFHGKQSVKDFYIAQLKAHQAADEIIQGKYWENGKGCAVGCTIHSSDHFQYPERIGFPVSLAIIEDVFFEGLSNQDAKNFPLLLTQAVPVGFTEEQFKKVKSDLMDFIEKDIRDARTLLLFWDFLHGLEVQDFHYTWALRTLRHVCDTRALLDFRAPRDAYYKKLSDKLISLFTEAQKEMDYPCVTTVMFLPTEEKQKELVSV
jgi:hypothetical protein